MLVCQNRERSCRSMHQPLLWFLTCPPPPLHVVYCNGVHLPRSMSRRSRRESTELPVPEMPEESSAEPGMMPQNRGGAQLQTCSCGALFPMSHHRHCCSVCAGSNGTMHGRRCEKLQRALLRNGLAPRRRDRVCSSPACNRMAGNGYHACCSYCKYGRHSSRCDVASSGNGQSTGGLGGEPNAVDLNDSSLGTVAPWTPHLVFRSEAAPLPYSAESRSEGPAEWMVDEWMVPVATVQQVHQALGTATDTVALREVPTASSDEVLEIRLGSDFLQTLD